MGHDLRRIAEESGRAASIVRNLLAFARRQTAARVSQDIRELVERVLSLRLYELKLNSIDLVTDFEPDLPCVVADGGQLQQALLNLILNAERAMRGRSPRRLTVGARFDARAGAVELSVGDTGHGIDHQNLGRIFDPFFTTRDVGEGTGLGLSICYGIVRDHGGHIGVTSRIQVGTTFTILLPARIEVPDPSRGPILIAHLDHGERDFVAAALGAWGFSVVASDRASDALEHYRRGHLQAALVDRAILATDLEAWRKARAADAHRAPLVVMSTAADDGDVERFGHEQADAVLAPPFQLRALKAALTALLVR
jgi:CheY-like chemotaxis protein